jgi:hypothetical protein
MSALLLQFPTKYQLLQDDLESHFYVLIYNALRYLRSDKLHNLAAYMGDLFDDSTNNDDGTVSGGKGKMSYLASEVMTIRWQSSPHLTDLVKVAKGYVNEWFQHESAALIQQIHLNEHITEPPDVPDRFALSNHNRFIDLCQITLKRDGWPEGDKVEDQLRSSSSAGQSRTISRKRGSGAVFDPLESDKRRKRFRTFPN